MATSFASALFGTNYGFVTGPNAAMLYRLRRILRRPGVLELNKDIPAMSGAAVGARTVTAQRVRSATPVDSSPANLGGARGIETVTFRNSVTTSADDTLVQSLSSLALQPTYVSNGNGNPRGAPGL